mgnify:FL=1
MRYKKWRDGMLIPDTHEPGLQRGFGMSAKGKKKGSGGPSGPSKANKSVKYWKVGVWAGGRIDGTKKGRR